MKRVPWFLCWLVFILIVSMLIPGCVTSTSEPSSTPSPTPTPTPTPAKTIILKCATDTPPNSAPCVYFTWLGNEMEKRTQGRVKFENYFGGALYKGTEALRAMEGRVADIGQLMPGVFYSDFLMSNQQGLPGMTYPETAEGFIAASKAFSKVAQEFPELAAEWKSIKLICPAYQGGKFGLISKKEIRIPEDMKGHKIGGALGRKIALLDAFSAAGVDVIPPQIYMNMDRGVIDAAFANWSYMENHKLYEVSSCFLDVSFGITFVGIVMNNDSWKELPSDIQKILTDTAWEGTEWLANNFILKEAKTAKDNFSKAGGKIINVTPDENAKWDKAFKDIMWTDWLASTEKSGKKSGKALMDRWLQLKAEFEKK